MDISSHYRSKAERVHRALTIDPVIETTKNAGYNSEFPTLVRGMLDRAIDQGWGEHDVGR